MDPGSLLDGKYRIEGRLGEGGYGAVYRARHLHLDRPCAIKLMLPGSESSRLIRFTREAAALGQLKHPSIVDVFDFGIDHTAGNRPYLVMELLEGESLKAYLAGHEHLSLRHALDILSPLASAIDYAHLRGIRHRDLKPANIVLTQPGTTAAPKILDFGLAAWAQGAVPSPAGIPLSLRNGPVSILDTSELGVRDSPSTLTATGAIVGTPAYAAPEIINGEPSDQRSDIYSFAVLVYEMLVGHLPFSGTTADVLRAHLSSPPPPPDTFGVSLDSAVTAALQWGLAKQPNARPATATALVSALRTAGSQRDYRSWRKQELPRRVLLSLVIGAIVTLGGVFLSTSRPAAAFDRVMLDWRLGVRSPRDPDPRILLVAVDDASLDMIRAPLAQRADEFGTTITRLFECGATGVGVDFLIHPEWRESRPFSRAVLTHSDRIVLGVAIENGSVKGADSIAGLTAGALGPERASHLFGLVRVEHDRDGIIRRGRVWHEDTSGIRRFTWAARAASFLSPLVDSRAEFVIDTSIRAERYARISWRDVPRILEVSPGVFAGRLVLVGADYVASGDDSHRISGGFQHAVAVPGLVLQALLVDTIVSGMPIREFGDGVTIAYGIVFAGLITGQLLRHMRSTRVVLTSVAVFMVYVFVTLVLLRMRAILFPISGPLAVSFLGSSLVVFALSRSTPPPLLDSR